MLHFRNEEIHELLENEKRAIAQPCSLPAPFCRSLGIGTH